MPGWVWDPTSNPEEWFKAVSWSPAATTKYQTGGLNNRIYFLTILEVRCPTSRFGCVGALLPGLQTAGLHCVFIVLFCACLSPDLLLS